METLHQRSLVWDNHACMPLRPDASFLPQLARLRAAGIDMVVLNVMCDNLVTWDEAVRILSFMRHWILARPEEYVLAGAPGDIELARSAGKTAVAFDIEGMMGLGGQVSMVRTYYDLGVRWMLVAYNRNNEAGGGCMDADTGLTEFGRSVIREMESVGMALCCSHTGERTCMDVFEWSNNPVMLTHSNPLAMVDHPRCVTDEVMKACAATGGTVGVTGFGTFLQGGDTSAQNYFRHIDYAVSLVGAEHVALASDYVFDADELAAFLANPLLGAAGNPSMFTPEQFPELTDVMLQHGYSETAVRAILGENLLRLARQIWK
ncbi:MAG: membrane dipeptidase [Rhodothermales bacterium]|jgi:membrane dipeptidase